MLQPDLFDHHHAVGVGHAQVVLQLLPGLALPVLGQRPAGQASLQGPHGLLEALLEGAADGHGLPHALHLGGQCGGRPRKFLKCKAGYLQGACGCEIDSKTNGYKASDGQPRSLWLHGSGRSNVALL